MLSAHSDQFSIELGKPRFDVSKLVQKLGEQFSGKVGEARLLDCLRRLIAEAPWSFRQYDTVFGEQPACVIDERGALDNQALSYAMQRLQVLLLSCLHWHEAHSWP